MNGGLYRGSKPVMWSVVEKTALAEAEIEYHDHTRPRSGCDSRSRRIARTRGEGLADDGAIGSS